MPVGTVLRLAVTQGLLGRAVPYHTVLRLAVPPRTTVVGVTGGRVTEADGLTRAEGPWTIKPVIMNSRLELK